jgi:hypothetical protein
VRALAAAWILLGLSALPAGAETISCTYTNELTQVFLAGSKAEPEIHARTISRTETYVVGDQVLTTDRASCTDLAGSVTKNAISVSCKDPHDAAGSSTIAIAIDQLRGTGSKLEVLYPDTMDGGRYQVTSQGNCVIEKLL